MSRIILAWELGGNYGHISRLVPLIASLKMNGHDVSLIVRDISTARQFTQHLDVLVLQTPLSQPRKQYLQPISFADVIANAGFDSFENLYALVRGWHDLFKLLHPDVVVAEYAPVAILSSKLANIPCLRVDTGFAIPPDVSPWPSFRPWLRVASEQLLVREMELLAEINHVAAALRKPKFGQLYEAVRSDLTLITSVPELDHYPGRKNGRYIGPLSGLICESTSSWPIGDGSRIFVYIRPFSGFEKILEILVSGRFRSIVVIPDIDASQAAKLTNDRLTVLNYPVEIGCILRNADLVISHAGHGLSSAALMAGVPVLAIPTQIEQLMLTNIMEQLGIGKMLSLRAVKNNSLAAIQSVMSGSVMRKKALRIAAKYADYDLRSTLTRLVTTIERLPASINIRR